MNILIPNSDKDTITKENYDQFLWWTLVQMLSIKSMQSEFKNTLRWSYITIKLTISKKELLTQYV